MKIIEFSKNLMSNVYEGFGIRFNGTFKRDALIRGFSECINSIPFYTALNSNDQDSLNTAAGGNFLDKMPENV
ncbi:hypothetical protein Tco_1196229 [Tanacetum coccineum]